MLMILKDRTTRERNDIPPHTDIVLVRDGMTIDASGAPAHLTRELKVLAFRHGDGCSISPGAALTRVAVDPDVSIDEALGILKVRAACPSCCKVDPPPVVSSPA